MKSGFVELVVKVAKKDRKIPIAGRKKYNPLEAFKTFTEAILPKIEQRIEVNMLKNTLSKTPAQSVREELINAYIRRLTRLRFYEEEEIKDYKKFRPLDSQETSQIIDPSTLKDINDHTFYDIGWYTNFLTEDMERYFKHQCFGNYSLKEYFATRKFGVQLRSESIRIVNILKRIQNESPIVDWDKIMKLSTEERRDYVNDQDNYVHLFNSLSNRVYEKIKGLRGLENFKRTWGSSVISDTLVNSVLNNLYKFKESPLKVLDEAVQFVMDLEVAPSPGDFNSRFSELKLSNTVLPLKNRLAKNATHFWDTPSFKNVFLGGEAGTGRSMILTYIAMWAFKNNWVVINCTSGYRMAHDKTNDVRRCYNGLFLTPHFAKLWLEQFRQGNLDFLKKTKVKKELYGKCDISGRHEDEYEPVPNLYDPKRKVHFFEVNKMGLPEDPEVEVQDRKMRMSVHLPNPETLNDIAIVGLKNEELSTSAIAELFEQIYALDHPTLVCVDGFNWFYRPSAIQSYRYFNDRGLFGHVPPYHIALCRLFMDLDGHRIKRGLKVVASSNYPLYNHKFDIAKLMLPKEYEHKVPIMTREEFDNAARFNLLTHWWLADELMQEQLGYMYTLCQGNWGDFQQAIANPQYY